MAVVNVGVVAVRKADGAEKPVLRRYGSVAAALAHFGLCAWFLPEALFAPGIDGCVFGFFDAHFQSP